MTRTTYVVGLVGAGIGPSLTPAMHEREGERHGLKYIYRRTDIAALGLSPDSVRGLVDAARHLGFDGLNITHPCKQLVIASLDDLAPDARTLGAVNTVVFTDGRAVGHNTDLTGFTKSFRHGLPGARLHTVLQVGAGGAGAAVANALGELGVGRLLISDLDPVRAEELAATLRASGAVPEAESVDHAEVADALPDADGVVNATPMGMAAHPGCAVPLEPLRSRQWVADIVYRPLRTPLVDAAQRRGCRVLTGAGMAVFQAVDAFALFTGLRPDPVSMFSDFQELAAGEGREDEAGGTDA